MKEFLVILLTSLILVLVWFYHGHLLGGGEAGILFYNLEKIADISFPAWGNQILGGSSGITVSGGPFFVFLSYLQRLGITGYIIQAVFFGVLLFLTVYSANFLYRTIFDSRFGLQSYLMGMFYLFNSYALMNIWNRFLPNTMMFYSLLPLVLGLHIKAIKEKRVIYIIFSSLLTALFAYGFAAPAQTLVYLGLVFGLYLFEAIVGRNLWQSLKYFLVTMISWFAFNFWWIYQQISFRFSFAYSQVSSEFFSSAGNLDTFNALSTRLGQLKNLWLLKHGTFFSQTWDLPYGWPLFYDQVSSFFIEWGVILLVLFVALKFIKSKWVVFLLTIFVIGIFAAKGGSAPLGELFGFLFERVSYIQFFRNPFEKLGLLLPLALSPLFSLSIGYLSDKYGRKILLIAGIYLFLFLGFPFWSGLVFTSGNPPANDPKVGYQVVVPDYYRQADTWFSAQPGVFRFMSLPLGGEGIFYKWPKGYVGVEQSGVLFRTPSISYNTTISFYHQIASKFQRLFMIYKDFPLVANLLSIRYILYRPDIDFRLSGMRDPETLLKILFSRYQQVAQFGPLRIFDLNNQGVSRKIYPASNVIITDKIGDLEDLFAANASASDILVQSKDRHGLDISSEIVHSNVFFEIDTSKYPQLVNAPDIFPYVSRLPDDKFYPLVLLKEKLGKMSQFDIQVRTRESITLLGKRLIEVKKLKEKNSFSMADKSLKIYLNNLVQVLDEIKSMSEFKQPTDTIWRQQDLFNVFSSHLQVLMELGDKDAISIFKKLISESKILPFWDFIKIPSDNNETKRAVFRFEIADSAIYEMLIPKTYIFPTAFSISEIKYVQTDDQIININPEIKDNYLSLGKLSLKEGTHEISFIIPSTENLVKTKEIILDTEKVNSLEIPIMDFDPFLRYEIGFTYLSEYGDGVNVDFVLNNDPVDQRTQKIRHSFSRKFNRDNYSSLVRSFSFVTGENETADNALLRLRIDKWNNCRDLFQGKFAKKCDNKQIYDSFNRPSRMKVSNLHVYPKFPAQAKLVSRKDKENINLMPVVDFEKIDSTKYKYKVKNATAPFLLVFSELFDGGWQNSLIREHFLVNGYANAWKINKTGDFDGEIEFYPQKLLRTGYIISGVSITLGILLLIYLFFIKQTK